MSGRRVLVTGGTGFIGSNLVRRLLADGHEPHLLVRRGRDRWRITNILRDLQLHEASIEDKAAVNRVVSLVKPQWVFHLATHGGYAWQTDLRGIVATNVVGTANLLDASLPAGIEVFVNAGSSSEYGFKDHGPDEEETACPNSHYAVAKTSATLLGQRAARRYATPVVTLRLYSAYGPFEEPGRLIPALILCGLQGRLPPLADPKTARDFVYVDDVCDAFVRAAAAAHPDPASIYNVGSGVQTSLAEVVEVTRSLLPIPASPVWGQMPDRAWDTTCWVAKTDKASRMLGWRARHSFAEGLAATIDWFRDHPTLQRSVYGGGTRTIQGRS